MPSCSAPVGELVDVPAHHHCQHLHRRGGGHPRDEQEPKRAHAKQRRLGIDRHIDDGRSGCCGWRLDSFWPHLGDIRHRVTCPARSDCAVAPFWRFSIFGWRIELVRPGDPNVNREEGRAPAISSCQGGAVAAKRFVARMERSVMRDRRSRITRSLSSGGALRRPVGLIQATIVPSRCPPRLRPTAASSAVPRRRNSRARANARIPPSGPANRRPAWHTRRCRGCVP